MTVRGLIAVVTAGALALSSGSSATAGRVGRLREISLGASTEIYLFGLAPGPDGNMWFADMGCIGKGRCAIGRITPKGRITAFLPGLNAGSVPFAIATGPDGNLWFTDEGRTPAIGRITPSGEITEFSRGLRRGSVPFGIAGGLGRELWFTDHGCQGTGSCAVGEITPRGRITELSIGLRRGTQPLGIAAGRGGDAWFADASGAIGRIAPGGQINEFSSGLNAGSSPVGIAAGPDGNAWFSDEGATPAVGRITPEGRISEFSAGLQADSEPAFVVPAPDGQLWFTDEGSTAAVGHLRTGAPAALQAPPLLAGSPRVGRELRCRAGRWATWAGVKPSIGLFSFDGYRWLRSGVPIAGHRADRYTTAASDTGRRLSCRATVTYPVPFLVSASATSAAITVRPAQAAPGSGMRDRSHGDLLSNSPIRSLVRGHDHVDVTVLVHPGATGPRFDPR